MGGPRTGGEARPTADGSGDLVRLGGSVFLMVNLRGLGPPFDTGPGGVFEGTQLAFVGLHGAERPFRVFALTNPTRVVVDVRHP